MLKNMLMTTADEPKSMERKKVIDIIWGGLSVVIILRRRYLWQCGLVIGCLLLLVWLVPEWHQQSSPSTFNISLSSTVVPQGNYLTLYITPLQSDHHITLTSNMWVEPPKIYTYAGGQIALIPISYHTEPETYQLEIKISSPKTLLFTKTIPITVTAVDFPRQYLQVSEQLRTKRDEKLWELDRAYTTQAKAHSESNPLWQGIFIQPAVGRITTEFGTIRYINGVDSGRHSGIDVAAPNGTPIYASNSGVVKLAQSLHVTGNTIVIDHGLNLFTSYCHLDTMLVNEGQLVSKGELIGTM